MKSPAAAESAAFAHYLQFRIQWASIALIYYDYALTFPAEIKYIWGKKFRFSTVLYICCRYALIANVLYLAALADRIPNIRKYDLSRVLVLRRNLNDSNNSCDDWYKFVGVISVLGRAAVIATLTGRTYAVFGCNRLVLASLGSLGLACIILDVLHVPGLNCIGGTTDRIRGAYYRALLTIVRCLQECRVGGSWKFERGSFLTMISQQGTSYYCIISIFTTAAVVLNFRAATGSFLQRLPNAFNLPVSCLLTARFLLQLREWQSRDTVGVGASSNGAETRQVQTLSALQAVAVVDAALLDDFGDYNSSAVQSSWETESTRPYDAGGFVSTDNPVEQIALDGLGSVGETTSEKDGSDRA